jgi:hypothetical protein
MLHIPGVALFFGGTADQAVGDRDKNENTEHRPNENKLSYGRRARAANAVKEK